MITVRRSYPQEHEDIDRALMKLVWDEGIKAWCADWAAIADEKRQSAKESSERCARITERLQRLKP